MTETAKILDRTKEARLWIDKTERQKKAWTHLTPITEAFKSFKSTGRVTIKVVNGHGKLNQPITDSLAQFG